MFSSLRNAAVAAAALVLASCSSGPKTFERASYSSAPDTYTKAFTDVASGGILGDHKVVIVPDFMVKFELVVGGTAKRDGNQSSLTAVLKLKPEVMQALTDEIYAKFVADLKAMGYTVIETKELAEKSEEFKKYFAEKMVASPLVEDKNVATFAPTGMKVEDRGVGGIFTTNLNDVAARAAKQLDAVRISPVFTIGFANAQVDDYYSQSTVTLVQRVVVRPNSGWFYGDKSSFGWVKLKNGVGVSEDYGTWTNADTAGDSTRNVMGALFGALGGDKWKAGTRELDADQAKYKASASEFLKDAENIIVERAKMVR